MARTPRRSSARTGTPRSLNARLVQLEQSVTDHQRQLEVQLRRIAQLQADVDAIRLAWHQVKPPPSA